MHIKTNPIYERFPQFIDQNFHNYDAFRVETLPPDFSITTETNWKSTAQKIVTTALKIIILPWGLCSIAKALLHRVAMYAIYPAQFQNTRYFQQDIANNAQAHPSTIVREVVLEKDGHPYNGLIYSHQKIAANGKWALFAPGNGVPIEYSVISGQLTPYVRAGYNLLLVNGPGAGKSRGPATVEKLGDSQEIGLTFLETAINAEKIILAGHSLGAAAIGLAALKHTFRKDVDYLAIQINTFDRLTHTVQTVYGTIISKLVSWLGCEMDTVAASNKFTQEGIPQRIFESLEDELMENSRLSDGVDIQSILEGIIEISEHNGNHNQTPSKQILDKIIDWETRLANKEQAI